MCERLLLSLTWCGGYIIIKGGFYHGMLMLLKLCCYREQSIFDCMIGNLFEEYRFFPKYPERQLKIAAILFGKVLL